MRRRLRCRIHRLPPARVPTLCVQQAQPAVVRAARQAGLQGPVGLPAPPPRPRVPACLCTAHAASAPPPPRTTLSRGLCALPLPSPRCPLRLCLCTDPHSLYQQCGARAGASRPTPRHAATPVCHSAAARCLLISRLQRFMHPLPRVSRTPSPGPADRVPASSRPARGSCNASLCRASSACGPANSHSCRYSRQGHAVGPARGPAGRSAPAGFRARRHAGPSSH